MAIPPELLGPAGLLVASLLVIGVLWRDHLRADADDRAQRDTAIAGWRAQVEATNRLINASNRLAAAIEARNRRDERTRRENE